MSNDVLTAGVHYASSCVCALLLLPADEGQLVSHLTHLYLCCSLASESRCETIESTVFMHHVTLLRKRLVEAAKQSKGVPCTSLKQYAHADCVENKNDA